MSLTSTFSCSLCRPPPTRCWSASHGRCIYLTRVPPVTSLCTSPQNTRIVLCLHPRGDKHKHTQGRKDGIDGKASHWPSSPRSVRGTAPAPAGQTQCWTSPWVSLETMVGPSRLATSDRKALERWSSCPWLGLHPPHVGGIWQRCTLTQGAGKPSRGDAVPPPSPLPAHSCPKGLAGLVLIL